MAKIQINGVDRPIATNMRAMRLFKEKTGRGMLGYVRELAKAAAESKGDEEDDGTAALDLFDSPLEVCALIWAALNGPSKSEISFEEVESSLGLRDIQLALSAITEAFTESAISGAENPPTATAEATTTSTSESSGASAAAA